MLTLALLAMITSILLEYINKSLKFRTVIRLYQELLDRPRITYTVGEITKPKHKNLAFLVPDNRRAGVIPKTMIFVNNIEDVQRIAAHFFV